MTLMILLFLSLFLVLPIILTPQPSLVTSAITGP